MPTYPRIGDGTQGDCERTAGLQSPVYVGAKEVAIGTSDGVRLVVLTTRVEAYEAKYFPLEKDKRLGD